MLNGWLPDIQDFKGEGKKRIVTLVLAGISLWLVGWKDDIFSAYKFKKEYDERVKMVDVADSVINYKTTGPGAPLFLGKMFNSPYMLEHKEKEKKQWTEESFHKDSAKAKMSTYLVMGTGMNRKAMEDTLVSMINWYKDHKKEVIDEKKFDREFKKEFDKKFSRAFRDEIKYYEVRDGQMIKVAHF